MKSNNKIAWQQWQSQYGSPLKKTPDVRYWEPDFTQLAMRLVKDNIIFFQAEKAWYSGYLDVTCIGSSGNEVGSRISLGRKECVGKSAIFAHFGVTEGAR